MELNTRKIRLGVIILLAILILFGFIAILILGHGGEASTKQTTITAISTLVGSIIGALAVVVQYYFDSDARKS